MRTNLSKKDVRVLIPDQSQSQTSSSDGWPSWSWARVCCMRLDCYCPLVSRFRLRLRLRSPPCRPALPNLGKLARGKRLCFVSIAAETQLLTAEARLQGATGFRVDTNKRGALVPLAHPTLVLLVIDNIVYAEETPLFGGSLCQGVST